MLIDYKYVDLLSRLIREGERISTRNSNVFRLFPIEILCGETPLISVRKTAWKNALREWEWFMSGSPFIKDLHPSVRSWWDAWADKNGIVAFNYSEQFRQFTGVDPGTGYATAFDQIESFINGIKEHPYSRRNVITTWNPYEMSLKETPITNCHNTVTQAFVNADNSLHLVTYQRSVDVVCGLPHNLIQMWAFLKWLACRCNKGVGTLTWIGGDVHLYEEHKELAEKIIAVDTSSLPTVELVYIPSGQGFRADDFSLSGSYQPVIDERAKMIV